MRWQSEKIIRQPIRWGHPSVEVFWDCIEYEAYRGKSIFSENNRTSEKRDDPDRDWDTWLEENMPF